MFSELTSKERILRAIRGQETDRTPWCPWLAYFWSYQPESVQRLGEFRYIKALGGDPLFRGTAQCFTIRYDNCNIREETHGNLTRIYYETKVGTLVEEYTYLPGAKTRFLTNHPVETAEDLKLLQYLCENMKIVEDHSVFDRQFDTYGDEALVVPVIGSWMKTAFQYLLEHWCGTENLTYLIYDEPEALDECLAVMCEKDDDTLRCTLNSRAEAILFFEDSSTTNISPSFFNTYAAPQIKDWADKAHQSGKLILHHACGHIRDLLLPMAATGIDAIESISPPPTGNVTLQEARSKLPENVALIGGIEPVFFERCTMAELNENVEEILRTMRGTRYVLANSDSCPPGVTPEKFRRVTEIVKR